ncbi:MAG: hypothetical protein PHV43_02880 [Candidatus Colwellbacteria bacterium]|nr:hypothetical protein [Candidatus Colwellbacteria bacterium]
MLIRLWRRLPYWFQRLVALILVLGGTAIAILLGSNDNQIAGGCWVIGGVFTSGIGSTLLYSVHQNRRWEALDQERKFLEWKEKLECTEVIAERMVPDISDDDEERAALDWERGVVAKGLAKYPLFYLRWLRTSEKGAPPPPKESA